MGTDLFFVSATPSRDTTSLNSGLLVIIPIALEVSIDEPPPIARIKSAPEAAKACRPALTLATVGFGLTSLKTSYGTEAVSSTFNTLSATPNLIRSLSVTTRALCSPKRAISFGSTSRAPGPKYETSFNINRLIILFHYL